MKSSDKTKISGHIVKNLCYNDEPECEGWTLVEAKIINVDESDGGSTRVVILQDALGNFYEVVYTDWEIGNNGNGDDYEEEDEETGLTVDNGKTMDARRVYPKEITTTIYE